MSSFPYVFSIQYSEIHRYALISFNRHFIHKLFDKNEAHAKWSESSSFNSMRWSGKRYPFVIENVKIFWTITFECVNIASRAHHIQNRWLIPISKATPEPNTLKLNRIELNKYNLHYILVEIIVISVPICKNRNGCARLQEIEFHGVCKL